VQRYLGFSFGENNLFTNAFVSFILNTIAAQKRFNNLYYSWSVYIFIMAFIMVSIWGIKQVPPVFNVYVCDNADGKEYVY
jgi:hypothetical protein